MSIAPERPEGVPAGLFAVAGEEAAAVEGEAVLSQLELGQLYGWVKDSLPMVMTAVDIGDDGALMGGGSHASQTGRVVSAVQTHFFPFAQRGTLGPWRTIGTLTERITVDHELGDELAKREFRLLWDGADAFDLIREDREGTAGASAADLRRLLGYFGQEAEE
ncbi:MAG TPA: hypothetical protein VL737_02425 [Candidatus Pristimantibacillus sp.]|nr:hypothetical protein [Candidatus Pristimantibacillus sp.]